MKIQVIYTDNLVRDRGLHKATDGSAAYDLISPVGGIVQACTHGDPIDLGFKLGIDHKEVAAMILPRSGLGARQGIVIRNLIGLIDSDYQGAVTLTLANTSDEDFHFEAGDRLVQMIFVPIVQTEIEVVDAFAKSTSRGEGGFGSTGK